MLIMCSSVKEKLGATYQDRGPILTGTPNKTRQTR